MNISRKGGQDWTLWRVVNSHGRMWKQVPTLKLIFSLRKILNEFINSWNTATISCIRLRILIFDCLYIASFFFVLVFNIATYFFFLFVLIWEVWQTFPIEMLKLRPNCLQIVPMGFEMKNSGCGKLVVVESSFELYETIGQPYKLPLGIWCIKVCINPLKKSLTGGSVHKLGYFFEDVSLYVKKIYTNLYKKVIFSSDLSRSIWNINGKSNVYDLFMLKTNVRFVSKVSKVSKNKGIM